MKSDGGADLHMHTTASDGDLSPRQLMEAAAAVGLRAVAITDHDTMSGLSEAAAAGQTLGVEVVPGIELSVESNSGQCHILGLFIRPGDPGLQEALDGVIRGRDNRNALIVERLCELGLPMTLGEVEAVAGGDVVARPHFARVMVTKGYSATMQEAFDEYLASGARAYLPRERLTAEQTFYHIHQAGGLAILAHPNHLRLSPEKTEAKIAQLKEIGLDGIEARYNLHIPADNARYLELADRLGLLTSGGSDFHGVTVKPHVFLGHVDGDRSLPYAAYVRLREAACAN